MTDETRLKAAIVGCGAIAHEHARAINQSERATLVAVADRSLALAEFFCTHYGVPTAYTDVAAMLDEADLDVLHICTPPRSHDALARQAIDAGCHVICEKPLTPCAADTEALLAFARERNIRVIESSNSLFNENVVRLRSLIGRRKLGEVTEVEVTLALDLAEGPFGDLNLRRGIDLPAGAVHDFLPHICGLFLSLSGAAAIDSVVGRLENWSGNQKVGFDYLDCTVVAGQVRGLLRITPGVAPPSFRIVVRGTAASAETDLFNPHCTVSGGRNVGKRAPLGLVKSGFGLVRSGLVNLRDKIANHTPYHSFQPMFEAIYAYLLESGPEPVAADFMVSNARLIDRIAALPSLAPHRSFPASAGDTAAPT